jgi:uroporphyrinogen-III synthase
MALNIKKVLISQPRPTTEKSPYFDIAEKYGVEIDFRPFIKVEPLNSKEFRQQKVSILDHSAVIFTARTAIDHFFHLCEELRVSIPETMKYFCMTEAIAVYLQKYIVYRKRKIFFGQTGKLDDLVAVIAKHAKENISSPYPMSIKMIYCPCLKQKNKISRKRSCIGQSAMIFQKTKHLTMTC